MTIVTEREYPARPAPVAATGKLHGSDEGKLKRKRPMLSKTIDQSRRESAER
jgi:hypothetical protein